MPKYEAKLSRICQTISTRNQYTLGYHLYEKIIMEENKNTTFHHNNQGYYELFFLKLIF